MLGVVALLSGIAYLFTPLTAAGPEGNPTAFTTNLRYASPAIGLGALLLAVDAGLTRPRVQGWLLGAVSVLLLVQAVPIWDLGDDVWRWRFALGAIGLAVFLVAVPVGLALAGQRGASRGALVAGTVAALAAVVVIGWPNSDDYLDERYRAETAPADFPEGIKGALAWFNREDPRDSRIAVVGGRPGFKQYVFYGDDLSNDVHYVARHGSRGAYLPIASKAAQEGDDPRAVAQCEEWRRALNAGDYDYLIAGPDQRTQSERPIEALWTGTDSAAQQLELRDDVYVFALNGELDPASCARQILPG
jgi:peptidoglycan/LPS O-acetylase OafA/YrhL